MAEDLEPGRPKPNFRCLIITGPQGDPGNTGVSIPGEVLQDVYDIAVNSVDFGSGFLSTEEVGNLRILGKAIGAEYFDYQNDRCLRCGHENSRHYRGDNYCGAGCDCQEFVRPA